MVPDAVRAGNHDLLIVYGSFLLFGDIFQAGLAGSDPRSVSADAMTSSAL